MDIVGKSGSHVLFSNENNGVVIDVEENTVVDSGPLSALIASTKWKDDSIEFDESTAELAQAALTTLNVSIVSSAGRMYTIPKGAQEEAKRGLEWRKEHDRGGTPVGVNSARTLAKGGQIGIEKVRHIAKYFPRHEIDKKATGYQPGEKGFPSRGRIAWALWGGDAGWKWAQAIVERENKKALRADGYTDHGYEEDQYTYATDTSYDADVDAFKLAAATDNGAVEFIARMRMDGSGIDRLYKVDEAYNVSVWDAGFWHSMPETNSDFASYDLALDNPDDTVEKTHVEIDAESALFISACLQENPGHYISLFDINYDEADMIVKAASELDYTFMDRVVTAAAAIDTPVPGDGNYTPEERAKNADKQVRDKTGKFSKVGSRVVIGGDTAKGAGNIIALDPAKQSVRVQLDSGSIVDVPAIATEAEATATPTSSTQAPIQFEGLDTSGILGEPRVPIDRPNAKIPGTLPALSPEDLGKIMGDWPAWVKSQRDAYTANPSSGAPKTEKLVTGPGQGPKIEKSETIKALEKLTGIKIITDPYTHPVLKSFLNKKVQGSDGKYYYPNKVYYQPVVRGSAEKAGKSYEMTPVTSDVQPLFFAVVSQDDPGAVLELVSLVPASSTSTDPMTYIRKDNKWVREEAILADLNSPTPPPVVPLDGESLKSVIEQVDGIVPVVSSGYSDSDIITVLWGANGTVMMMTAAGGADRNRGNAETLRRYWTVGKGALKIRWNTPGDWTRCYRNLKKYMGPRAKGYCSLRHHEVTGMWPGDKNNPGMNKGAFAIDGINSYEEVLAASILSAKAADARLRVITAGAEIEMADGGAFRIPLVIPEDLESGDGRKFKKGAIEIRELPLPLMWQIKTDEGHNGSVVVGRIDFMERTENGIGNATGVFDSGAYGQEAERLVREGFIRGVSADLDQFEASQHTVELSEDEDAGKIGTDKLMITHARVMAVTLVPKPAFQECQIYLVNNDKKQEDIVVIPDGVYADEMDPVEASAIVACGLVAGSIPVTPPRSWFDNPQLRQATPLTVDEDGRVFGHIAAWHVDHIGMSFGTRPPRSKSKYAYFHTGVVRTDDNTDIPVGQLTLAGGHASLEASASEAARHYDDTGSAIADVHAGEDAFGIWVSGALRPGTSPEQVRALRASAPSGDWRPIKGQLELVAVCQVNVPGFPIARARVASGAVMALVAAGAQVLARMKSDPVTELSSRIEKLEQLENAQLSAKADVAKARFIEVREEKEAQLSNKAAEAYARIYGAPKYDDNFGYISREKRQKLAKEGKALPDGSYPITNLDSLKDSIQAYGRSKPGKRAAVRRHIKKMARKFDRPDLIPENWKSLSMVDEEVSDLRSRLAELSAALGDDMGKTLAVEAQEQGKYTPDTQPRDEKGKFRVVLARIKQDLGDAGLQDVVQKVSEAEQLNEVGNYQDAAKAANDVIGIVDRLDAGALNPQAIENVRSSAKALGEVIANLPLPFGSETEKVRYSDLPPALKNLMDDMLSRVTEKIGAKDAEEATVGLRSFMSGGDYYTQQEISSELSKLLRLLT